MFPKNVLKLLDFRKEITFTWGAFPSSPVLEHCLVVDRWNLTLRKMVVLQYTEKLLWDRSYTYLETLTSPRKRGHQRETGCHHSLTRATVEVLISAALRPGAQCLSPFPTSDWQLTEFKVISYQSICISLGNFWNLPQESDYNLLVNIVKRQRYKILKSSLLNEQMNEWMGTPILSRLALHIVLPYVYSLKSTYWLSRWKTGIRPWKSFE